jgi:hypothetical protein
LLNGSEDFFIASAIIVGASPAAKFILLAEPAGGDIAFEEMGDAAAN